MARTISAVTVTFGTALRRRSMRVEVPAGRCGGSGLEAFDFVPQRAVLRLVSRPDLLLRDFTEFIDLGFDDGHAERLKQSLGCREVVDRLRRLADFFLSGARKIEN